MWSISINRAEVDINLDCDDVGVCLGFVEKDLALAEKKPNRIIFSLVLDLDLIDSQHSPHLIQVRYLLSEQQLMHMCFAL